MKHRTIKVREGELLGPVDWDYDFNQHDWDHGGAMNPERLAHSLEMLKKICAGGKWEATTDGGNPKCGWGAVLQVGMYDGWPYWKPTPSVFISSWMGGSWSSFTSISSIRPKVDTKE